MWLVNAATFISDLIEHPIDERAAFLRAVTLRQFHGLVQRDGPRHIQSMQKLVHTESQHVAVDARHAFDAPMRTCLRDARVKLCYDTHRAAHDLVCVGLAFGVTRRFAPEVVDRLVYVVTRRVDRKQDLQGGFAGCRSSTHSQQPRLVSSRTRETISIAASAASKPLFPDFAPARSTAC